MQIKTFKSMFALIKKKTSSFQIILDSIDFHFVYS